MRRGFGEEGEDDCLGRKECGSGVRRAGGCGGGGNDVWMEGLSRRIVWEGVWVGEGGAKETHCTSSSSLRSRSFTARSLLSCVTAVSASVRRMESSLLFADKLSRSCGIGCVRKTGAQ